MGCGRSRSRPSSTLSRAVAASGWRSASTLPPPTGTRTQTRRRSTMSGRKSPTTMSGRSAPSSTSSRRTCTSRCLRVMALARACRPSMGCPTASRSAPVAAPRRPSVRALRASSPPTAARSTRCSCTGRRCLLTSCATWRRSRRGASRRPTSSTPSSSSSPTGSCRTCARRLPRWWARPCCPSPSSLSGWGRRTFRAWPSSTRTTGCCGRGSASRRGTLSSFVRCATPSGTRGRSPPPCWPRCRRS
ncbi:hypothetical protein BU14_0442s0010 [Porphyra umbilicalis]|uniref:Uncharacterized protein n=1 Tax=Porphyra umbilicalis TaxID=2786 RepID=A0A1X6NUY4_PORUM|nr:hypothetical protein BU14_0442s0010 [Porphyra umbilicalis]|eukprot:OSX72375.1 hypothetical protein BU14_0442s0010 [Porphyra umbilicalis]